ncbi:IgaA/UmoB family intracellular growth attenuator [Xenorhabdus nematophila]
MASFLVFRWRRPDNARYLPSMTKTGRRKLNADEYQAIEYYLRNARFMIKPNGRPRSGYPALPLKNDDVYTISYPITRFSAATDESHHWRYYIDETEIHLPVWLEPFIKQQNTIEIVQTTSMLIVIALNGHFLKEYQKDLSITRAMAKQKNEQASIQKNGNSSAKLLNVRKETLEEHRLRCSTGIQEGILLCVGMSIWFAALFLPLPTFPWLISVSILFILGSFWLSFRLPAGRKLSNIHCFSGIPKRWGIFSEFEPEQRKNISLGGIDLIYPSHWESYVSHDLDQNTDIDMYVDCHVVRQGRHLSLHEEEKHYPYQCYRKNMILVAFSVTAMLLLYFYQPVSLSMRLSFAWLYGSNTKVINSVTELQNISLKEGDVLKVKGTGMCYFPPEIEPKYNYSTMFIPFNCWGIYWNSEMPIPLIESDVIDNAAALINTVNEQLYQIERNRKVNPGLNEVIAKPGMTLLGNFSQIILKTHHLCQKDETCTRLQNALVNLGNAKSWHDLLNKAEKGKLDGIPVILRTVSAEALQKLVDVTTANFIYDEIHRKYILINSPLPGGVLLLNAERKDLVEYPFRTSNMYENSAMDWWHELLNRSEMMMRTPFETGGIVTGLFEDTNGTLNITLHREPDTAELIRYLGSCFLLAMLLVTFTINIILIINKIYKNRRRIEYIMQYYANCLNGRNNHAELRH